MYQDTWVLFPAVPLTRCMTFGKIYTLPVPPSPMGAMAVDDPDLTGLGEAETGWETQGASTAGGKGHSREG